MKASLLLLVLSMGAATVAQATDCTPVPALPTEGQPLAASDTTADSLSALDGMLGSHTPSRRHGADEGGANYADQPGPAMRDGESSASMASDKRANADAEPPAASSSSRGTSYSGSPSGLGWQSLLPGSIQ